MVRGNTYVLLSVAGIVFAVVVTLFPVFWMVSASFETGAEVYSTVLLDIGTAGWPNFLSSYTQRPLLLYLFNSALAAFIAVVVLFLLGARVGYSLAKLSYHFSNSIPLFLEMHAFGWTNTYAGLILPTAFTVVAVFIFRQAIVSIPEDNLEAARIDGASESRILFSIEMSMVLPSAVVVAVLTFNLCWNSYLWLIIVVNYDALRILPLGMAAFQSVFNTQFGQMMAVSIFGAIPTLPFFIAFQRHFIEGAVSAGIK